MSGHYDYLDGKPVPKRTPGLGRSQATQPLQTPERDDTNRCTVDGCENHRHRDTGVCATHLDRKYKTGAVDGSMRSSLAKVTDAERAEIMAARRRLESNNSIGRRLGIDPATVAAVVRGERAS